MVKCVLFHWWIIVTRTRWPSDFGFENRVFQEKCKISEVVKYDEVYPATCCLLILANFYLPDVALHFPPRRHWMQDERIFHLWSNGRTGWLETSRCRIHAVCKYVLSIIFSVFIRFTPGEMIPLSSQILQTSWHQTFGAWKHNLLGSTCCIWCSCDWYQRWQNDSVLFRL